MLSHDKFVQELLSDPLVRKEYERIEQTEMPMLDAILKARTEAGLTQAEVAKRMGTHAPAVARLESALVTGKPSPSLVTLQKYAAGVGRRQEVRFIGPGIRWLGTARPNRADASGIPAATAVPPDVADGG